MRAIAKKHEPPSLTRHRQADRRGYDSYRDKDALRCALVAEQHGICCYCMSRIHNHRGSMKIEHWRPRSHYPDEQLVYQNLLGACCGGEGKPLGQQHCDTRKGGQQLRWNPADPDHRIETRLWYKADGSIRSHDGDFEAQLESVLNLNLPFLKNNRKEVWDNIGRWWRDTKVQHKGPVPRTRIEQERDRWLSGNGQLNPYCQVAIWLLDQRLEKMTP